MAPVRQQQLIRIVACLVAFNVAVGVVALSARTGTASTGGPGARTSHAAGRATAPDDGAPAGGILAGGRFSQRRGSGGSSTGQTADPAASQSAAGAPATTATVPASPGSSSTSSTARPTTSSTARATTSSTVRPTTSSTARPTTSSSSGPPTAGGSAPAGGDVAPQTTPGGGTASTGSAGAISTTDDRAGDTVVDGTSDRRAEKRADIIRSQATYRADAVVLTVQVAQPVDPRQDPKWASAHTFLAWEIDTNGDATPDIEIQYFLDEGGPVAGVSRVGDPDGASLCDAEAGYTADGYTVAFESGCLGGASSFSYRASTYYDSDPQDENADVISDVTPDGGLSRPVTRSNG